MVIEIIAYGSGAVAGLLCLAALVIRAHGFYRTAQSDRVLRRAYGDQLDAVGDILVRAKVISRSEVLRQGVQFAVRDRFEPRRTLERNRK